MTSVTNWWIEGGLEALPTVPPKQKIERGPKQSIPIILDPNLLLSKLPLNFTKTMVSITIGLRAFTVISTYLMVVLYRVAIENNPIPNNLGIVPYMFSSATIVCLAIWVLYRRAPRDVTFPLLFGLFLVTVMDAAMDATTAVKIILWQ